MFLNYITSKKRLSLYQNVLRNLEYQHFSKAVCNENNLHTDQFIRNEQADETDIDAFTQIPVMSSRRDGKSAIKIYPRTKFETHENYIVW